jgi:ABC-type branched-subunit amino acid transport system ATPase component
MKIIELRSENVKKVKAIEIIPKDNIVIISGKNGQGKTSVLDSIWYALEGKTSLKDTPMPIRKGEKKAEVTLTLDDFIVTRNWTGNDKSYLKVTNKEGLSYGSPQELLDSFIGKLAFDPLEFAQMKENEQRELLLEVTGLNFDSLDNMAIELREKRRIQGQTVKLLSGERETITIENLPGKLISVTSINDELQEALIVNTKIDEAIRNKEQAEKEVKRLKNLIISCEEYLQTNEKIPIDSLKEKLNDSQEINEQVRAKERNNVADNKLFEAQKVYDEFTEKIEDIAKEKETALSTAKMPITGLSISETGVIYNDIPFGQLSSSEQLKVSLAIAMALNPKLKVIRITDGSLLDDDSMEIIRKLAEKKDYQVWLEKVDGTGKIGFYIEEGEVKCENDVANEDVPF